MFMTDLPLSCTSKLFGGNSHFREWVAGRAPDPSRPLLIEVSHPDLVVDRIVFPPAMQNTPRRGARLHSDALPGDAQQILVQVAPERPPDGVVVADALLLLLARVTLEAQASEFDHHAVGAERSHGVDTQRGSADVVRRAWKQIDHLPAVSGHAGKRQHTVRCSLIRVVFDLHRTHRAV